MPKEFFLLKVSDIYVTKDNRKYIMLNIYTKRVRGSLWRLPIEVKTK